MQTDIDHSAHAKSKPKLWEELLQEIVEYSQNVEDRHFAEFESSLSLLQKQFPFEPKLILTLVTNSKRSEQQKKENEEKQKEIEEKEEKDKDTR